MELLDYMDDYVWRMSDNNEWLAAKAEIVDADYFNKGPVTFTTHPAYDDFFEDPGEYLTLKPEFNTPIVVTDHALDHYYPLSNPLMLREYLEAVCPNTHPSTQQLIDELVDIPPVYYGTARVVELSEQLCITLQFYDRNHADLAYTYSKIDDKDIPHTAEFLNSRAAFLRAYDDNARYISYEDLEDFFTKECKGPLFPFPEQQVRQMLRLDGGDCSYYGVNVERGEIIDLITDLLRSNVARRLESLGYDSIAETPADTLDNIERLTCELKQRTYFEWKIIRRLSEARDKTFDNLFEQGLATPTLAWKMYPTPPLL